MQLKLNQQYASPSSALTPLTTLGSRLKFAMLLALLIFIPALSLKAYAVNQAANQIIVKYKDPSQSPLASSETSRQIRTQLSQEQSTYKAIAPKRTDLVLIESENSERLLEQLKKDPNVEQLFRSPHHRANTNALQLSTPTKNVCVSHMRGTRMLLISLNLLQSKTN